MTRRRVNQPVGSIALAPLAIVANGGYGKTARPRCPAVPDPPTIRVQARGRYPSMKSRRGVLIAAGVVALVVAATLVTLATRRDRAPDPVAETSAPGPVLSWPPASLTAP